MATASRKKQAAKKLVLKGKPNPAQEKFFLATEAHIAFGGARYGGKSWAMRRKCVLLALLHPGIQILLLRRTLPELRENHLIPLLSELDGFAKYSRDENAFIFPNKARLKLGYCDNDADVIQYQGQSYDVVCFEEATNFTEFQWNQIKLCCRTSETIQVPFRPRRYYTSNPGGVGHAWFKRIFIDRDFREGENPGDYVFIPARIYDNKIVMERNPEYLNELKSLPEELRRAYLDGDWTVFQGMFFTEWNPAIHVIEPFEIPIWWKKFRSLDYGQDMTACLWWAVSDSGQCFIYRELHEPDLILSQAAKKIVEMTPPDEHISYTVASPDLWSRRQETGASGMELMSKAGLKGLVKANNNRIPGWRQVREHIHPYPLLDNSGQPVLDEHGAPKKTAKLLVFNTCKNLIRCMPLLQFDPHNSEDAAKNPHNVTHGPEALRYGAMSRHPEISRQERMLFPPGTSVAEAERIRGNMEFEKVYQNMQNRGGIYGGW